MLRDNSDKEEQMPAMIEQFDSMFSVRQMPWHGLGIVLDEYPSSVEEALMGAGLEWQVDQQPVYVDAHDSMNRDAGIKVEVPDYRANVRLDTGQVLGIVSDQYTVVQNEEAFRFLDSLINSDLYFETAGSLQNGRKVWVLARIPEFVEVGGDPFANFLFVTNAHDGTAAVTSAATNVRIVCGNTYGAAMRRADRDAQRTYKFRHVGDLQERFGEAREVMGLTIDYNAQFKEMGDELARRSMSLDKFVDKVAQPLAFNGEDPETMGKRALKNRVKQVGVMADIFAGQGEEGDTRGNAPGTAWTAYNTITEYADWNRRYTKRTDQMQRSFEDHDLANRGLELVLAATE
jgi:phage/plasmid-like protein (TIGR03299 family)